MKEVLRKADFKNIATLYAVTTLMFVSVDKVGIKPNGWYSVLTRN